MGKQASATGSQSLLSNVLACIKWVRDLPGWIQAIAAVAVLASSLVTWWINRETPRCCLYAPFAVDNNYKPGGFMGDGQICSNCVEINGAFKGKPRPGGAGICVRISYSRPAGKGFAGIYWTYPDQNWGEHPGWKVKSASKVSFWAAGDQGGEVVDFKAGGIASSAGKPFSDSFEANLGKVVLENDWRYYEIGLKGCSLKDVIGAFAWSAAANWNPSGLVFYLDDIRYQ